jgi:uncharacterized protein (TIGR02646 family)
MIRVRRPAAVPPTLSGPRARRARQDLAGIVRSGRRPRSDEFKPLWGEREVRDALSGMQHKKCCYCERHREVTRESDIEHFRPKAEVTDCVDAGYWWLAFEWTNLLFSCRYCNQEHKKNHFPLMDEAARARRPRDRIGRERPYLIDPSREDPSEFIGFDWVGGDGLLVRPYGRDALGRGSRTIDMLGLDRLELNMERAELLLTLQGMAAELHAALHLDRAGLINRASAKIRKATAATRKFAGFAREYFRAHNLGEYVADD